MAQSSHTAASDFIPSFCEKAIILGTLIDKAMLTLHVDVDVLQSMHSLITQFCTLNSCAKLTINPTTYAAFR